MNPFIDELSKAVLKRPLQDCNVDELQRLIDEYPYFGPGQLLLAKKLSEQQADNSSLYKEQVQKTSLYFQNRVWLDHLLSDSTTVGNASNEKLATTEESISTDNYPAEETAVNQPMEHIVSSDLPETQASNQPEQIEETVPPFPTQETDISIHDNVEPSPVEITVAQEPLINETESQVSATELETNDADLSFQPYHTVDYFASQGIKFREEEKPKDRFSAQLKSFTEWLKTLKRVSATEIALSSDPSTEKKVEQMAEYSIAERYVNTEAMAEVWKKQGNKEKAEEIYRKLSLLDPSKSSYFAAKIEDLKKTS